MNRLRYGGSTTCWFMRGVFAALTLEAALIREWVLLAKVVAVLVAFEVTAELFYDGLSWFERWLVKKYTEEDERKR